MSGPKKLCLCSILLLPLLLTGCGSKRTARVNIPPTPVPETTEPKQPAASPAPPRVATVPPPVIAKPPAAMARPVYTESGIASWYGPSFHSRHTSNGEIYDMNSLTAAHRTLPFNSIVRVTNVSSGQSVVVRVTDRGPFVAGRVIDLSRAAAKQIDIERPGTARVQLEVLSSPAPIATGGRWAVQIGGFQDAGDAAKVKNKLERRYRSAQVLQVAGATGDWWVRVRVADDDRRRAEEIAHDNQPPQGGIYLVRLD